MWYFVGLGSNIEPRRHLPLMLQALLQISPILHVGRVQQTDPVDVVGEPFLNVPAAITTDLAPQDLKALFNAVEASLGRNRADPASKVTSRTADLDILFRLAEGAVSVPPELLPEEPYMRPMLLELLGAVGVTTAAEPPALAPGVSLRLDEIDFGEEPLLLSISGGRIRRTALATHTPASARAGQL